VGLMIKAFAAVRYLKVFADALVRLAVTYYIYHSSQC